MPEIPQSVALSRINGGSSTCLKETPDPAQQNQRGLACVALSRINGASPGPHPLSQRKSVSAAYVCQRLSLSALLEGLLQTVCV